MESDGLKPLIQDGCAKDSGVYVDTIEHMLGGHSLRHFPLVFLVFYP
jgi:hypothetical protein